MGAHLAAEEGVPVQLTMPAHRSRPGEVAEQAEGYPGQRIEQPRRSKVPRDKIVLNELPRKMAFEKLNYFNLVETRLG
jgi:hypothetical protein